MTRSCLSLVACVVWLGVSASPVAAQKAKGKRYALLVGVNEYDNERLKPLKFAENDVEVLSTVLSEFAGFDEVVVLTNTRGKKDKALMPTTANVQKRIEWLTAKREKEELILFAFAGLGSHLSISDPKGNRRSIRYSYLFPRDADLSSGVSFSTGRSPTLILVSELMGTLSKSKAGTKLLLLDASREDLKGGDAETEKLTAPAGTAVLFSCRDGERSWESPKIGKGHGVFFHFVLSGLRGDAKNRNDEVRWSNLAEYVAEQVSEQVPKLLGDGAKQTPVKIEHLVGPSPVLTAAKR